MRSLYRGLCSLNLVQVSLVLLSGERGKKQLVRGGCCLFVCLFSLTCVCINHGLCICMRACGLAVNMHAWPSVRAAPRGGGDGGCWGHRVSRASADSEGGRRGVQWQQPQGSSHPAPAAHPARVRWILSYKVKNKKTNQQKELWNQCVEIKVRNKASVLTSHD